MEWDRLWRREQQRKESRRRREKGKVKGSRGWYLRDISRGWEKKTRKWRIGKRKNESRERWKRDIKEEESKIKSVESLMIQMA